MALYVNRFCAGRSLSNPGLRRFSVSTGSRSLHADSSSSKKSKALTFASLSVKPSIVDPNSSSNHCGHPHACIMADRGPYARCASLFLPTSGPKTHDSDHPFAMAKTRASDDPGMTSVIQPVSPHPDTSPSLPPSPMSTCALPPPAPAPSPPPPLVFPSLDFSASAAPPALPSPTARARRAVSPSASPPMHILSSPSRHTLDVHLPPMIQPDMVTISAKRGDRLEIVADAWHMEADCHYEWQISFAPHDIDMSSVHAKFNPDGLLTIDVRRRPLDYTVLR